MVYYRIELNNVLERDEHFGFRLLPSEEMVQLYYGSKVDHNDTVTMNRFRFPVHGEVVRE